MNQLTGKPLPVGQAGYWQLVFNDEFDNPQIDPNKWVPCYWWNKNGCTNEGTHEQQWYLPEQISVRDGALQLTAIERTVQGSNGKSYQYTSGMVTTGRLIHDTSIPPRFALKYGYVEVRARAPKGQGIWPAIWMLPTLHESKPEIDIMEILGGTPDTVHMNFHYKDAQGASRRNDGKLTGTDLTGDWHVFAVDWKPGSVDWYIDGDKVRSFAETELVPAEPMYLLINLAVGGDWGGPPDATTIFPSVFEIDYVRIWKPGSNASLIPIADTYVDPSAPGQSFGSSPRLSVDGNPKDIAFLKYNLSGLSGRKIASAWLRVKTTDEAGSNSQHTQTVHIIGPDTWDESMLAPPEDLQILTANLGHLSETEMNTVYDIPLEVSPLQQKLGGMLSLAITAEDDNGITIYTRESPADPPLLMIVTEEKPIRRFLQKYWNDIIN